MALLITTYGEPQLVEPKGRTHFTLTELQAFVGGYLELVARLPDGRVAWCNEDGKRLRLPVNRVASAMLLPQLRGDVLVGDVIVTTLTEAGEDTDLDPNELMQPLDPGRVMTQTWWLSFADPALPKGQQSLGVAIVDVTDVDIAAVRDEVDARQRSFGREPTRDESTYAMAAAVRKAHQTGCNPGGEVLSARIDTAPEFATLGPRAPRQQLLSKADIDALGLG